MQEITAEIALRNEKRPDVSMMTGVDACLYGTLALGGDGIFSAITYLMPEVIDVIYSHYGKGPEAFACQCDLIKLIDVVNRFTFPYGYRLLSEAIGMPLGPGREPVPASVGNRAKRAVLEIKELFATIADKYLS